MLENTERNVMISRNESQQEDLDLPLFGLSIISAATNNFSENNKLGEGGFGPVYRVSFSFPSLRTIFSLSLSLSPSLRASWDEMKLNIDI